jgi:peptide/nickel transport system permease protein
MLSRLIDSLVVLFGVVTLVFFLSAVVPGDPVDVMLGEHAASADREALRAALGLDRPLLTRWADYVIGLGEGDLGQSLVHARPVAGLIAERLPATLSMAAAAFGVVLLIAFPLGTLAAQYRGGAVDRAASLFALLGQSIPNFWLGPMLVLLFSVSLGWLPVSGNESPASLILPALTLGTSLAAISMRMLRASLLEVAGQDYLRTARAKGLGRLQALYRHALPNALLPVVTLLGLQLGALLSGAVITEVVFAWPGIGSLLIDAIRQRDYPVIQGVVLVIAVTYVLINLATDLLLQWLDPRIRSGGAPIQ